MFTPSSQTVIDRNDQRILRRHLRQRGERRLQFRLVVVAVFQLAGEVIGVRLHVEMAVARQIEQDGLRLALGLAATHAIRVALTTRCGCAGRFCRYFVFAARAGDY